MDLDSVLESALEDLEREEERRDSSGNEQRRDLGHQQISQQASDGLAKQALEDFAQQLFSVASGSDAEVSPAEYRNLSKSLDSLSQSFVDVFRDTSSPASCLGDAPDIADEDRDSVIQLLKPFVSKELLYGLMIDLGDKYPKWLEDKQKTLSEADFAKYSAQFETVKKVCDLYEQPESAESLLTLVQLLHEMGQPPVELAGQLSVPALPPF